MRIYASLRADGGANSPTAAKLNPCTLIHVAPPHTHTHTPQTRLYSLSRASLPVTSPSVATMSARSGSKSAVTAAHPAMAVRCRGDVGWCPPYRTLFAAGPEAVLTPSTLLLLLLLQVERQRCEPRGFVAGNLRSGMLVWFRLAPVAGGCGCGCATVEARLWWWAGVRTLAVLEMLRAVGVVGLVERSAGVPDGGAVGVGLASRRRVLGAKAVVPAKGRTDAEGEFGDCCRP